MSVSTRGLEARESRARENLPIEIVLVRHAEPDYEWARETGGDPGLTAFGREQAARLAAHLKGRSMAALHCSPLRRAVETAQAIAAPQQLAPEIVPDLEEIRVPLFRNASQTEVDAYFASALRRPLREHWEGFPGGERFRDFHARVTAGLEALLASYGARPRTVDDLTVWTAPARAHTLRIGIVAHGGANAVMLSHLLGVAPVPWEWFRFETPLAAFSIVALRGINDEGYVWSLQQFGRRAE